MEFRRGRYEGLNRSERQSELANRRELADQVGQAEMAVQSSGCVLLHGFCNYTANGEIRSSPAKCELYTHLLHSIS